MSDSQPNESPKTGRRSRGRKAALGRKAAWWPAAAGFFGMLLCAGLVFYIYASQAYKTVFFPNTRINGVDVSDRTLDEVKSAFSAATDRYQLAVLPRGGETETIGGTDISLHTVFDGKLEQILADQNPYRWILHLRGSRDYRIETMVAWDEEALTAAVSALECMDESRMIAPKDAYLSDYTEGQGYQVVPEENGTTLRREAVMTAVSGAVKNLVPEISLEALGCYEEPAVRSGDPALNAERDARNHYVNVTVTYTFGDQTEVLGGSQIREWLVGSGADISLDSAAVTEYVAQLAKKHNTAYKPRNFKTSYGPTVAVSGSYGWRINQKEEAAQLLALLQSGQSAVREPVYAQKAAAHGEADYGNTYAEVNLTAQHMFFYKDGNRILESDFVSGNVSRGHTTPAGLYSLTYKQRDAVLRGEGYASPVKFWMPFNGGIGFHDASWRSSFGGAIYKTGGSHGCVNMPYAAAKELFENVYAGMPVICYNLPGTESKSASSASGKAPASGQAAKPTKPAQTAPPVQPAETQPAGGGQAGGTQPAGGGQAGGAQSAGGGQAGGTQPAPPNQPAPTRPADPTPPVNPTPPPTQPSDSGPGAGNGQDSPQITPVGPGVSGAGGSASTPESGAGYGPAFGTAGAGEGGGPGA